ncbi:MAG: glycine cleavage system protein H [Erysipelotrichaceae bacterium]
MGKWYSKTHEWMEEHEGIVSIGISAYAAKQLGDLVYLNLAQVGDHLVQGQAFMDVESVKAVNDLYAPISGVVVEVNTALEDDLDVLSQNPLDTFLVKVEKTSQNEELMDEAAYEAYLASL